MPDPNDDVLEIPEPSGSDSSFPSNEESSDMEPTGKFHALAEQNMAQLGQTGVITQNNFVFVTKAQDLDYLENKRLVTLEEAVGIREVSSKSVPAGPSVNSITP